MSVQATEYVPNEKLKQFTELLCCCGGRFTHNPSIGKKQTLVSYEIDDYTRFSKAWVRVNTPIIEKRKDTFWHKIIRRLGINI